MIALLLALSYWVQPCTPKLAQDSGCTASDPQLAEWALDAWQSAAAGALKFEKAADEQSAKLRVYWAPRAAGLYGEARGQSVYIRPDVATGTEPLLREAIVYLTCLHETGHALGMPHTAKFEDIMYSFGFGGDIAEYFGRYRRLLKDRASIQKYAGMSEADRRKIQSLFAK